MPARLSYYRRTHVHTREIGPGSYKFSFLRSVEICASGRPRIGGRWADRITVYDKLRRAPAAEIIAFVVTLDDGTATDIVTTAITATGSSDSSVSDYEASGTGRVATSGLRTAITA
jgi:hypothetical protein